MDVTDLRAWTEEAAGFIDKARTTLYEGLAAGRVEALIEVGSDYRRVPRGYWRSDGWKHNRFGTVLATRGNEGIPERYVGMPVFLAAQASSALKEALQRDEEGTGDPGRPSLGAELYMKELSRLVEAGELALTVSEQARVLHEWFKREFPTRQAPAVGTITNRIRSQFKHARNELIA